MTLVACIRADEATYVSADICVSAGNRRLPCTHKLWKPYDDFLVAVTGDLAALSLVKAKMTFKDLAELDEATIHDNILKPVFDSPSADIDFELMLVSGSAVITIDNHWAILHHAAPFVAIGNGAEYAHGYYDASASQVRGSMSPTTAKRYLATLNRKCSEAITGIGRECIVEEVV